jgi:predicted nucleic acid-binding protein
MKVVFDAGVVFSGAGWRGEAHRCLLAMAHRRLVAYATEETLKELSKLLADRGDRAKHPPATTLSWYQDHVKSVEPGPLGKQRSRDVKDDPYLACALGAGAKIIVTRDGDLPALGKPFGIQMITPRELLVRLSRPL